MKADDRREPVFNAAESKPPRMCGNSTHGNREIPQVSSQDGSEERSGKATGRTPDTHASGKSDDSIVPQKQANNAGKAAWSGYCGTRRRKGEPTANTNAGLNRLVQAAEPVEERESIKGNAEREAPCRTQSRGSGSIGLDRVREVAKRDKQVRFTSLLHHVDEGLLRLSFWKLNREAGPGVDGVTWREYAEGLEERLADLHERLHRGAYRAQPSKRVWIPKADGRQRPIGIAALEDKIVQQAVRIVLEQIYEEDFLGFSYGFRPGRGCHNALDALYVGIVKRKVNYVLDADIRGFFDAIDHEWMQKFLEHRIADRRILRLIRKWLRAGVSEDGEWSKTSVGTPQGSVISPLLANVFLHYVFDLWADHWRNRHATGDVIIVRYADDFVVGFQHRGEAERFLKELRERLEKFRLELHPEKTRLIEFGRFAAERRKRRGEGRPETFDFLGFKHICGEDKRGWFELKRQSVAKRMRAKLQALKEEFRRRMHQKASAVGRWLRSVVQGWYNYHAVPGNQDRLNAFRDRVTRMWLHVLRRRSQRGRKRWTWKRFRRCLVSRWIPSVRIQHPYPTQRLIVTT
jgi:RNA-directed DNA polymerase